VSHRFFFSTEKRKLVIRFTSKVEKPINTECVKQLRKRTITEFMDSKIGRYEKILKKHGITLSKEKLLELIDSIDQLAECFLNFAENSREDKRARRNKGSTSKQQHPSSLMRFLRMDDVLKLFSSS